MSMALPHRAALPAGLLLLAAALGGCSQRMAAKVNGQVITQEQFYNRCANFTQGQLIAPPVGLIVLDSAIMESLLEQEARRLKQLPSDAEVNAELETIRKQTAGAGQPFDQRLKQLGLTVDQAKSQVYQEVLRRKLMTQGVTVSDKEIEDFYNRNKQSQFTTPEQVEARQITVPSEAAAKEVKQMLDKNADFTLVARSKSIDTFKDQGGKLPTLTRGFPNPSVAPEVFSAAFNTAAGKIVGPMKAGNNWVILKVESKKPQSTRTLADVKEELRQGLMLQKAQQGGQIAKFQQRMMELRRDADIQVGIDQFKPPIMQAQQALKQAPAPGMTPVLPGGR